MKKNFDFIERFNHGYIVFSPINQMKHIFKMKIKVGVVLKLEYLKDYMFNNF